ncbi:MAG: NAD-dependent epimerase/dehydratase family protein [Bacteroidia bacterium]
MIILFTGITGSLGRYFDPIIRSLCREHKLYILFRQKPPDLADSNVIPLKVDLLTPPQPFEEPLDVLFHAAFALPFGQSKSSSSDFLYRNEKILLNTLKLIEKHKPRKIIYLSTHSINEDIYDPLLYLYAQSKSISEQYLLRYCRERAILCHILRLPAVVSTAKGLTYDMKKVSKPIALFPFSLKKEVVFISCQDTFSESVIRVLFSEKGDTVWHFRASKPFTYRDKIYWIKKNILKGAMLPLVFSIPTRKYRRINWQLSPLISQEYIELDMFSEMKCLAL